MSTSQRFGASRSRAAAWTALCGLLFATGAAAQVREPDNFLATTLVFSSAPRLRHVSTRHASPTLSAGLRLSEHGQLRLDWGLPYTTLEPDGDSPSRRSHVGSSNLLVALHHVRGFADDSAFVRMGVGVALPLARHEAARAEAGLDAQAEALNYATASAVRGLADPWLWALDTTSVVFPMSAGLDLPGFQLRADVALGLLVPVSRANRDDTHFVAQAALEAALALGLLEPGVRAQVVSPRLTDRAWDGENSQLSVEPFVRVRLGPAFARAGVRVDLGDPERGPSPSAARMWALGLGLGIGI
ncbi:hypothetical protein LZ198_36835 [Myxococcus sp. K15C18031901]|uniref:hypothetical protein n=1 Tax=Myxococcus dinghuensis TaxID=2906761 RepID=UPI0020A80BA0|nr:hypothetical protein [Myxococcus dinghuensis]MCP3104445.1 hypothetical protein [Myxococcus dinghuensis]